MTGRLDDEIKFCEAMLKKLDASLKDLDPTVEEFEISNPGAKRRVKKKSFKELIEERDKIALKLAKLEKLKRRGIVVDFKVKF